MAGVAAFILLPSPEKMDLLKMYGTVACTDSMEHKKINIIIAGARKKHSS